MNQQQFLRPADGVKVRHPDGRALSAAGETVDMTSYWRRRLAAGDVLAGKPARPVAVAKTKTAPTAAHDNAASDGLNKGKQE
ncbi:MAG TPA: DUF2635 domain-containing protein [Pseudoxanthomonas sp.]